MKGVHGMNSMELLRELARSDKIAFKKHALLRMHQRGISAEEIKEALMEGEEYPEDKPLPSFLVLGYAGERPLHVVVALDLEERMIWVITAYEPSIEMWEEGFRRRVKR